MAEVTTVASISLASAGLVGSETSWWGTEKSKLKSCPTFLCDRSMG